MMTSKQQVLKLYPSAIVIHDGWGKHRDKDQGKEYTYLLVNNLSFSLMQTAKNGIIEINVPYHYESGLKHDIVSDWCSSPETCWENAWNRILKQTLDKFNE